jgi:hypothetical protein
MVFAWWFVSPRGPTLLNHVTKSQCFIPELEDLAAAGHFAERGGARAERPKRSSNGETWRHSPVDPARGALQDPERCLSNHSQLSAAQSISRTLVYDVRTAAMRIGEIVTRWNLRAELIELISREAADILHGLAGPSCLGRPATNAKLVASYLATRCYVPVAHTTGNMIHE